MPPPRATEAGGWLLTLGPVLFVALWSGGFAAIRLALAHAEPLTMQVLRYVVVLAVLAPIALLTRRRWPERAALGPLLRTGLLIQFGYFAACNLSQVHGLSATGLALAIALQPILVGLLAPRLAGERVTRRAWAGLLLGLAGAATVILSGGVVRAGGGLGLAFALAALAMLTAGALLETQSEDSDPVMANLILYGVGLLATLPLAMLTETMRVDWSAGLLWPLLYLVVANSLIATTLLLAMIRRGGAARVSALFFLVPPVAAAIAWVFLGERLAPLAWGGTALAAAGVALAQRRAG